MSDDDKLLNSESLEEQHRHNRSRQTDGLSRRDATVAVEVRHDPGDGTESPRQQAGGKRQLILRTAPEGIAHAHGGTDGDVRVKSGHRRRSFASAEGLNRSV